MQLRRLVITYGLPPETKSKRRLTKIKSTLRGRVWKVLLGVGSLDAKSTWNSWILGLPKHTIRYVTIRLGHFHMILSSKPVFLKVCLYESSIHTSTTVMEP
jgi:hypothetical protein